MLGTLSFTSSGRRGVPWVRVLAPISALMPFALILGSDHLLDYSVVFFIQIHKVPQHGQARQGQGPASSSSGTSLNSISLNFRSRHRELRSRVRGCTTLGPGYILHLFGRARERGYTTPVITIHLTTRVIDVLLLFLLTYDRAELSEGQGAPWWRLRPWLRQTVCPFHQRGGASGV